jgi:hypothetical protein
MNRAHEDGSMTIDNASVQRLMDYGLLHYTDVGWFVGMWPSTNSPNAKAIEAQRAETAQTGSVADESAAPKGFARKDQR